MEIIDQIIADHHNLEGPLLPVLHAIQSQLGYVPDSVDAMLAKAFSLSEAEVKGVISFYHDFRRHPPARHQLQLCCAEACQARGARQLVELLEQRNGLRLNEHQQGSDIEVRAVYCLGNCACGPSLVVDKKLHAAVTPKKLEHILQLLQSGTAQ